VGNASTCALMRLRNMFLSRSESSHSFCSLARMAAVVMSSSSRSPLRAERGGLPREPEERAERPEMKLPSECGPVKLRTLRSPIEDREARSSSGRSPPRLPLLRGRDPLGPCRCPDLLADTPFSGGRKSSLLPLGLLGYPPGLSRPSSFLLGVTVISCVEDTTPSIFAQCHLVSSAAAEPAAPSREGSDCPWPI